MNLQSMSIIFVIIFLPIILISTYYIQREVDTITMQTSYDTKLIDATTDAVSAFEINTANEDLSSVSDSLRSIIEASNNVFTTTLATNLGMSGATKSKILPYIPAVVYTLYDGYYIYSPTQEPKVVTDDKGVYVKVGDDGVDYLNGSYIYNKDDLSKKLDRDDQYGQMLYYTDEESGMCTTDPTNEDVQYTTNYILKSFIPYSAQYKTGDKDITINYTLDNFMTVYINDKNDGIYYTKSGYLIDYNNLNSINYGTGSTDLANFDIGIEEIDNWVSNQNKLSITYNGVELSFERDSDGKILNSAKSEDYTGSQTYDIESAIKYYLKAAKFSEWLLNEVGDLNENQIQYANEDSFKLKDDSNSFNIFQNGEKLEENGNSLFYNYTNKCIFKKNEGDTNFSIDEIDSNFYEHKRNVIKNSIQYNLNLAMAIYNAGQGDEYYQMPILSEPEWDKLLSNISVLAFMQGLPCGLKTYNNYALVTSMNNEIMANVDSIYYVPICEGSHGVYSTSEIDNRIISGQESITLPIAHYIDCKHITDDVIDDDINNIKYFESFPSREVKYDKVYNSNNRKYEYDHVCNTCYYCIVNSNYDKETLDDLDDLDKRKSAQLIAVGKIKNNTYKTRAVETNYGLKIDNTEKKIDSGEFTLKDLKYCYEIEITIENQLSNLGNVSKASYSNLVNDIFINGSQKQSYNLATDKAITFKFINDGTWNGDVKLNIDVNKNLGDIKYSAKVVSITYKYK